MQRIIYPELHRKMLWKMVKLLDKCKDVKQFLTQRAQCLTSATQYLIAKLYSCNAILKPTLFEALGISVHYAFIYIDRY